MKNSFRVLVGCTVLLCMSLVVGSVQANPVAVGMFLKDNAVYLMAGPAIVSASITPELINDLKVKYGKLKLITVVVEAPVYDIDNMPFSDRILFKQIGIDFANIINTSLDIEDRIKTLNELILLRDDQEKGAIAAELFGKYSGKIIEKGEQYQFLVKRPDRGLIKMLLPLAENRQSDEFSEKAIKNLIVGGDMEALEDGLVYMGVIVQLKELVEPAQSFLSKA